MEHSRPTGRRILACEVDDLDDGEAVRIPEEETGTKDAIVVFNDSGHFYALNDTCPHARASLSEGWVEDGQVECPMHGATFDLKTGAVLSPPATDDAVTHTVEIRHGAVWVLPEAEPDQ